MTDLPSTEPRWLSRAVIVTIHAEQIEAHGGLPGIRDESALESALGRPRHKWIYERTATPALAASYAWAIARNHPFNDGNKRIAFLAANAFLGLNGWSLTVDDAEVIKTFLALAAGTIDEPSLAGWVTEWVERRRPDGSG